MRCVIDTNVYLSFLLKPFNAGSPPTRIVQMIPTGRFDLIFPEETAAELRLKVETKPALHTLIADASVEMLIESMANLALPVEYRKFDHVYVPDPKDRYLLDAAASGAADFLITGDKPLIEKATPPKGTSIVAPAEFLKLLEVLGDREW